MSWIRGRLARVAAGWLVFQVALLVSVPATLCSTGSATAVATECTCDHAGGGMCPMHHTRSRSHGEPGTHSCSCRGTSDPLALPAALTGPPAVLATETSSAAPFDPAEYARIAASTPLAWNAVPDSPPPRA